MNRQWGGIVDTTPDACPIIGKTPVQNLFFNCGWGTGGFKATPAPETSSPPPWPRANRIRWPRPSPSNASTAVR
ncbi:FAD-dependent oxidoreductase [Pseudomonas aeruginosa]